MVSIIATGEKCVCSLDFLQNLHCCLYIHHHHLRNYFIIFGHYNSLLFLYYVCKCPQYNSRIISIKIATYYSQNYAGILGSSLVIYSMSAHNFVLNIATYLNFSDI